MTGVERPEDVSHFSRNATDAVAERIEDSPWAR